MSLPGPLPYEPKGFGAVREAPAKRSIRPYSERLKEAPKLIEDTKVRHGSLADSLPKLAEVMLILGAFAPAVLAIPGFGSLFYAVVVASYPFSAGLIASTLWLGAGWAGAILLIVMGGGAWLIGGLGPMEPESAESPGPNLVWWRRLAAVVFYLAVAVAIYLGGWAGAFGGSAGAVWVVLTSGAALYAAVLVARRQSWQGGLGGAVALIAGGRVIFGCVALVAIVLSDKAFPGQVVARHPWKRSEVALEPIEAPARIEQVPDEGADLWKRVPPSFTLHAGRNALIFGAFAPIVLAIPGFGVGLFGDLILALWPISSVAVWSAGSIIQAFDGMMAGGAGALGALLMLLWLVAVPVLGGLVGAMAVTQRRRRWGAVAGAVLVAVGGRPLLGGLALVFIAWGWGLFDRGPGQSPAQEHVPSAAAH